jgi:hypothetical protein
MYHGEEVYAGEPMDAQRRRSAILGALVARECRLQRFLSISSLQRGRSRVQCQQHACVCARYKCQTQPAAKSRVRRETLGSF